MISNCCNVVGSASFEDVPLPFFLKVIEWAESFRNVLGFFLVKLHFNFVFLDSDDSTRTRPKLLSKRLFREHYFLVQLEGDGDFCRDVFFVFDDLFFDGL